MDETSPGQPQLTLRERLVMLFSRRSRVRWRMQEIYPALSDADFLDQLSLNDSQERDLAVLIRQVIADMCGGVGRAHIHPAARLEDVNDAMCCTVMDGWDELDFVFRLEKTLGNKLVRRGNEPDATRYQALLAGGATLGDWLVQAIPKVKVMRSATP